MDKQQFQLIMLGRFVDLQDKTADHFAIFPNNIGCTMVDTILYDLIGFIPLSELMEQEMA